ncbi:MAG: ATP-grasp domain-containing protein [Myxococcales bacterium]|nr:ATP-grasp domain-containing protein [Myxococcales bacterium]
MAAPRWILDLHSDFPGSAVVLARLSERGRDAIVLERSAVSRGDWPTLDGPLVGYGTMFTMSRLGRHTTLGRAVFDDYPRLRCTSYYPLVYDLLGRTTFVAPFAALRTMPLARMLGERVFVRSDSNYKLFPAAVLDASEVASWVDRYREHHRELAVVSEVVAMDVEYRCYFRDKRFVCGSSYPTEPYRGVPDEVRAFAAIAAARLAEAGITMATIDVAAGDGVLRLVEAGGVNSWGIYGSSVDAFIDAMEAEAIERFEDGDPR